MAKFVVGVASVQKTVKVRRPGREPEEFTAEIHVQDLDEQKEFEKKAKKENFDLFKEVRKDVLAITGLDDANGQPLESSATVIDQVMKDPWAYKGIIDAWREVRQGIPEAEAKN